MKIIQKKLNDRKIRWAFAKDVLRFAFVCTVSIFLWTTYEDDAVSWVGKHVCVRLNWEPSGWAVAACLIYWGAVVYFCKKQYEHIRMLSKRHFYIILAILAITSWCRYASLFNFAEIQRGVKYVDVIVYPLAVFLLIGIINWLRRMLNESEEKELCKILADTPVKEKKKDKFDYQYDAIQYAKEIKNLTYEEHSWSIAITSPWGGGKTTMINLIKEQLEDSFIQVDFNARQSASCNQIQADFFTTMLSVLKEYDGNLKPLLNDYVHSLAVVDQSGVASLWMDKLNETSSKDAKDRVGNAIADLPKPLLVVFEDFDRLTREEMLEVLKIIDSNAAFKNVVFLSAYDKVYVNTLLGANNTEKGSYADKYFQVEYSVPYRPYRYLRKFLQDCLEQVIPELRSNAILQSTLDSCETLLPEYISTPRDAKRFTNMFVKDFEHVKDEVVFYEFFLARLIKYKYPDEFDKLKNKYYVEPAKSAGISSNILQVRPADKMGEAKCKQILDRLFPIVSGITSTRYPYRRICTMDSFDNYFCNAIYNELRVQDIRQVLDQMDVPHIQESFRTIANSKEKVDDIVFYIQANWQLELVLDENTLIHWYRVLATLIDIQPLSPLSARLFTLIQYENIKALGERISINVDNLKDALYDLLGDMQIESGLMLTSYIVSEAASNTSIHKERTPLCLPVGYIMSMRDEYWKKYLSSKSTFDQEAMDYFVKCWEDEGKISPNCASTARLKIEKDPSWYLSVFVRTTMESSSENFQIIGCEPFYKVIWNGIKGFEEYLKREKLDKQDSIQRCRNFWKLFAANHFEELHFVGMGNVQEKINNNLVNEVSYLEHIELLNAKVKKILLSKAKAESTLVKQKASILKIKTQLKEILLPDSIKEDTHILIDNAYHKIEKGLGMY